jgi:hypothetical protein
MTRPSVRSATVALLGATLAVIGMAAPALSQGDDDVAALQPFRTGVDQYVELHHRAEAAIPPASVPADAVNLYVVPTALRARLQRARAGTGEGKIFTPRAARVFKKLITQASHRDYAALMAETHEDRDELGRAMVNDRWPGSALTTMPPDLLAVLPPLPRELEYRFVHRDLVLWDVRADLIVDVLRDAIPLETGRGTMPRKRHQ